MGWKLGLACGMVLMTSLAGPFAQAEEKTNAAVMTTLMKGVGSEEKKAVTDGLWAALSKYYTLLPQEQVQQARLKRWRRTATRTTVWCRCGRYWGWTWSTGSTTWTRAISIGSI